MCRANLFKAECLVLKSIYVSHMRTRYKVKGYIVLVSMVRAKGGETVHNISPRSYKAGKAKGLRGKAWKVIERIGGDNLRKLKNKGRGRWDCILGIRCSVSSV